MGDPFPGNRAELVTFDWASDHVTWTPVMRRALHPKVSQPQFKMSPM